MLIQVLKRGWFFELKSDKIICNLVKTRTAKLFPRLHHAVNKQKKMNVKTRGAQAQAACLKKDRKGQIREPKTLKDVPAAVE